MASEAKRDGAINMKEHFRADVFSTCNFFFYGSKTFRINRLANYVVGTINIISYSVLFTILFIKGNMTFKKNDEIRMTIQVMVMSVIALFVFAYWELWWVNQRSKVGISDIELQTSIWITENVALFYYNAMIMPYLILNK
uniref:DUF5079 family protein n=1 Tax=Heterorhabditis bacteriophora TaxID=37862 RepID=A0A1I7WQG4_HETBA